MMEKLRLQGRISSPRCRGFVTLSGVWVATFAGLAIFYRMNGLEAQFLTSESGYFIEIAYQHWSDLTGFYAAYVKHPSNGHFTPLAFLAELYQARWFATSEPIWYIRQVALIAGLATAAWFAAREAMQDRVDQAGRWAAAIAALITMQPAVTDMVAWPFMALQVQAAILALVGAGHLYRFARLAACRSLWLGLGFSYVSMHFLGVGLAFSLAALVVAGLVVLQRGMRWSTTLPLMIFLVLTIVHAALMIDDTNRAAMPIGTILAWYPQALGATVLSAFQALLASLWYPLTTRPGTGSLLLGMGLVVAGVLATPCLLLRGMKSQAPERVTDTAVLLYPAAFLSLFVAMISLRIAREPEAIANYMHGPRYVFFSTTGTGLLLCGLLRLVSLPLTVARTVPPILAVWAIVANQTFISRTVPVIWPHLFLSHTVLWKKVLDATESAVREGRPVQNFYLPDVGWFGFEAKRYEGLIRHELGLPADHRLAWTDKRELRMREFVEGDAPR